MNITAAHQKWGHLGMKELRSTAAHYNIKLTGNLRFCDGCARAKARRKKIGKDTQQVASKPGQRLFLDTAGPFEASTGGSRYWVKVVDDMSHKGWDFFLKKKSDVPLNAKRLIILLKQKGYQVEYLRCDNAGEHQELTKIAEKHGFALERTGANTLQLNGVVERRFVTDFDLALAAMNTGSLTKAQRRQLWPEICKTISHPTDIVMNSTSRAPPDTLFYG